MFGFIGETIGKIFGTDKAASSLIENVSSGFDKLVYTDQEKAGAHAADVTEARKMVVEWLSATSGQNLARRVIAFMITGVWVIQYFCMVVLSVVAVWVNKITVVKLNGVDVAVNIFKESSNVIGSYAERMNGAVMLILAFYFAAPHMDSIVNAALKKFGGQK